MNTELTAKQIARIERIRAERAERIVDQRDSPNVAPYKKCAFCHERSSCGNYTDDDQWQCESCAPDEEIDMCKGCQHPIDEEGMCSPGCNYYKYEGSWKCGNCNTWREGEKCCTNCGPTCEYCQCILPQDKMYFEYKMEDEDTFLCCGKCADDEENDLSDVSLAALWKFGTCIEIEDPEEFDVSDYKDYMFRDQDYNDEDYEYEPGEKEYIEAFKNEDFEEMMRLERVRREGFKPKYRN